MLKAILVCLVLALAAISARADTRGDCARPRPPDLDLAISACTRLLASDDWAPWAYGARGHAHQLKRDYDLAIADHTKAIAAVYAARGAAYAGRRDYDRAIADYGKAVEIDPQSAASYFGRGVAYGRKGDFERAIADYTKAIELDQAKAYYFSDRALAYLKAGKAAQGLPDVERALMMESQGAIVHAPDCAPAITHARRRACSAGC